jgi:hypothetical protein
LATGCGSVATDGSGTGTASLAVVPEYPVGFEAASLNLVIDRVRVRVVRAPAEWIVDTSAVFPTNAQSVTVRVSMALKARQEQLGVVVELWAGSLLIFSGASDVTVTEGSQTTEAPRIPLTYRGPGVEARTIRIFPRDTVLQPGGSFRFAIRAENGAGAPVGDVYAGWSIAGSGGSITPGGVLTAAPERGSVLLRAVAATGARDSTRIWFAPAPASIFPLAGAGQVGVVGSALKAPFVVRVLAGDGLGVPGIPVQFFSTAEGVIISNPVVITNEDGTASTFSSLGIRPGAQGMTAFVTGLGAAQFTFSATVGPPTTILVLQGFDQVAAPGAVLAIPLEVSVRDQFGNPAAGALVRWSVPAGGGQLGVTESVTGAAGTAATPYTMGPGVESNVIQATLVATGTSVLFTVKTQP